MKMAAVTSLMKYYPLPEALKTIAEAGYQGVELWGGFPHAFTDDFFHDGRLANAPITKCKALLRESGLTPVTFLPEQCFYPVNYLVTDAPPFDGDKLRERSIGYFERAIAVTSALEIPNMIVTTPFWGWRQHAAGFSHDGGKTLDRVIDTLGHLTQLAQRGGITLLLEPLTSLETTAVETLDDLVTVLDGVASPNLAAMLDTGHINVTATALGLDPIDYFRSHADKLGGRFRHLHIDDNHGDLDAHLLPGEGSFDFAAAYAVLRDTGYDGYLSAELMMFGANPVPPMPADLLTRTREHTERTWNG